MLIGEVSKQSGISTRMLRHYDSIGLVSPTGRTPGGYRQYSNDDVRRLFQVEALRSLGLHLPEIVDVLGQLSFKPAATVEALIARTRERLERAERLLRRLEQVQASDPDAWPDVLRTIELMRGLETSSPSARQRFALSLTGTVDADAIPLTEAALNESDPNVAGALDWALAQTGDSAVPALAEALISPVPQRRHRAVGALTKINSPAATAAIAEAFRHPDPLVRGPAALARGARGQLDAVPVLVAMIVDGHHDVEASAVLGTLAARSGNADTIAGAIANEFESAPVAARRRLTEALADIPGQAARKTLARLVNDPDRQIALTATFVLQKRSTEE